MASKYKPVFDLSLIEGGPELDYLNDLFSMRTGVEDVPVYQHHHWDHIPEPDPVGVLERTIDRMREQMRRESGKVRVVEGVGMARLKAMGEWAEKLPNMFCPPGLEAFKDKTWDDENDKLGAYFKRVEPYLAVHGRLLHQGYVFKIEETVFENAAKDQEYFPHNQMYHRLLA